MPGNILGVSAGKDIIGPLGQARPQARSANGKVGFVPQNYLQYTDAPNAHLEDQNEMNVDQDQDPGVDSTPASAGYESATVSIASASPGYDSTPPSAGYNTTGSVGNKSNYSTTDYEVQQTIRPTEGLTGR